jgi:oxygen-dependent protoporphyrinogen oxidase
MPTYEVIIIGAGISGLSFAHYCGREGMSTLIIEKDSNIGGTIDSHVFEAADGFWLELGAHTCYNSYRNLIGLVENCNIAGQLMDREKVPFKMLVGSRIKSIPFQLNLLELLLSAPRLFTLRPEGQSVESYYSRIVGCTNFERVIGPAINAVLSQKANDFPADMIFKKRLRRKDIIKKLTLTGGLRTITDAVALQKNIDIIKGKKVRSVTAKGHSFEIATDDALYYADTLALATPASAAAQLLQESFPGVSAKLSQIKVEAVESVGIAIDKELISIAPVAGLIPSSDSFYSVVTRDTVRHCKYRGFTFHFKPGLVSREAKLNRIAEVLGVKLEQLEHVVEKMNFIPSLKVGHNILAGAIEKSIAGSRLFLTGNYFDGMALEDCVTRSLKEFLRLKDRNSAASHGG